MRSEFETELNELHIRFSEMAMMINEAIKKSMQAFINDDPKLARQVIKDDQKINNREVDLEQKSFEMIALQQPVTSDLRMIVTILKASSDLERMGDHAAKIAQTSLQLQNKVPIVDAKNLLAQMATEIETMFSQTIDAYLKEDDKAAIQLAQRDDNIDKLAEKVDHVCIEHMKNDSQMVEDGTSYMLISTYLERMGDYVTNLCEWIVYLKSGKLSELNAKNHN
ncbi:phosphate signaling complex protein PhoU [Bombilactobacillus thymidiniphilus]|uniref:Phosphate-specific transport system accessory protein PhoU n=1 Tax=Bombilactobacillus thymidiniphilus TaxID=2923363 RepID=A0ABY4PCC5_9LACO|nr:phosphate signaling complex protein PhoU [Bombilactobacillus thymidiniphilus]UQS83318.1 phosphate signaling complex protein PhoU [Bombilactobacillus thymidiniphilus]